MKSKEITFDRFIRMMLAAAAVFLVYLLLRSMACSIPTISNRMFFPIQMSSEKQSSEYHCNSVDYYRYNSWRMLRHSATSCC